MNVPRDMRYTKTHEWVRVEKDFIVVGITDFAQHQLSELTYVELPDPDSDVQLNEEVAVVESVKAASDVYAPVAGRVTEVNEELNNRPDLVNTDAYGAGWIFKMKPANPKDVSLLLTPEQYEELLPDSDE